MFDQIDTLLAARIKATGVSTSTVFEIPALPPAELTVCLLLANIVPGNAPQTNDRVPAEVLLRYFVTVVAADAADAHRLLGDLVFDFMGNPRLGEDRVIVELTPPSPQYWAALGTRPMPCFGLLVPARKPRKAVTSPRVTEPMRTKWFAAPVELNGQVLASVKDGGELPLTDARIEFPELNLSVRSDGEGRFRFARIPGDMPLKSLRVHVRGKRFDFRPLSERQPGEPVVIRLTGLEA